MVWQQNPRRPMAWRPHQIKTAKAFISLKLFSQSGGDLTCTLGYGVDFREKEHFIGRELCFDLHC